EPVGKIAISGPFPEATLKTYAKQLRDGLLDAGIDRVTLKGARAEEIEVRLEEGTLRRLDLSVDDIASRINDNTRNLPSGIIEGAVDVQVRSLSERRTPQEMATIEVRSEASGEKIFLGDIAQIETVFDDDENLGFQRGNQAILLTVQRAVSADTLKTMQTMFTYMDNARAELPQTLQIEIFDVRGKSVKQRLGILLTNGVQGLLIVLVVLFLFLDFRIAFWTAMGIPVAFLATLAVMYASGQTINMISMFALILMLGIIVDDAIVVGEHTATRQAMGDPPALAAQTGALKMLTPVVAATLTTQIAFFPLFLIGGRLGDILLAIPLVVTAVLIASLVECFLILPGHMRHTGAGHGKQPNKFRRTFDAGLNWVRNGPYDALVTASYSFRYATLAACIAAFAVALALVSNSHVKFRFFPSPEPESLTARVVFGAGTPKSEQERAVSAVEAALKRAERKLLDRGNAGGTRSATPPASAARADMTGGAEQAPAAPSGQTAAKAQVSTPSVISAAFAQSQPDQSQPIQSGSAQSGGQEGAASLSAWR
ncbi:MAG: efflux RND transporter permease subunit, partial [Pseudomonadota bacterium]